jgi:hypothetical protein
MSGRTWTRGQIASSAVTSIVLVILAVTEMRESDERRELASQIEKMRREVEQLRAKADAQRSSTDGGIRD